MHPKASSYHTVILCRNKKRKQYSRQIHSGAGSDPVSSSFANARIAIFSFSFPALPVSSLSLFSAVFSSRIFSHLQIWPYRCPPLVVSLFRGPSIWRWLLCVKIIKPHIHTSRISLIRPTMPLCRRTLMPWGWVADRVRISLTMPSVSLPERWSCFWMTLTRAPALISDRLFPFMRIRQKSIHPIHQKMNKIKIYSMPPSPFIWFPLDN